MLNYFYSGDVPLCTADTHPRMNRAGGVFSPDADINPPFHDFFKVVSQLLNKAFSLNRNHFLSIFCLNNNTICILSQFHI